MCLHQDLKLKADLAVGKQTSIIYTILYLKMHFY